MMPAYHQARRRGFTLLEVLLAMALATIVLGAITMAIDFHLRVVERGRQEVEEAQLARALLRKMADDLRCAVRYEPLDVSSLEGLLGGSSSASSSGRGNAGTAQQATAATALTSSSSSGSDFTGEPNSETGEADESTLLAETVVWGATPGLYGNHYEMQVDVSRLPRIDQYEQLIVDPEGRPADLVSDVKTVAYYLGASAETSLMGLMRRELDRAATSFASQNGGLMALEPYQTMIAPEVLAIEFMYFDGLDWYPDWDSSVSGGLPVAVEIAVAISKTPGMATDVGMIDLSMVTGEEDFRVYRLLVHLPASKSAAEKLAEEQMALEAAEAAGATGTSSSSSATGATP